MDIELDKVGIECIHFVIHGCSGSRYMDITQHSRTFQDLSLTYRDILLEIVKPYGSGVFIATADVDRTIPHMLVQYKETDWEFVKRLASHFNASIVVDCAVSHAQFYFGVPERLETDLKLNTYEYEKDIQLYIETKLNSNSSLLEQQKGEYNFESYLPIQLGQAVTYQKIEFLVASMVLNISHSLPVYSIKISKKQGCGISYIRNENIKGAKLYGIIKNVWRNMVQIHFDLDHIFEGDGCIFHPYSGGENNELGYYMSIPGSRAEALFPTSEESDCIITAALRIADAGDERMQDPSDKHLRNEFAQELYLGSGNMLFRAGSNEISIVLGADGCISINGTNININADNNFSIGANDSVSSSVPWISVSGVQPKQISISAENQIILTDKSGSNHIMMNENCEIMCNASERITTVGDSSSGSEAQIKSSVITGSFDTISSKLTKKDKIIEQLLYKKEEQNYLAGNILSLATCDFISSAIKPNTLRTELLSSEAKKSIGDYLGENNIEQNEHVSHNPILDKFMAGNEKLFNNVFYGENVNKK